MLHCDWFCALRNENMLQTLYNRVKLIDHKFHSCYVTPCNTKKQTSLWLEQANHFKQLYVHFTRTTSIINLITCPVVINGKVAQENFIGINDDLAEKNFGKSLLSNAQKKVRANFVL